ncbi:hypothetical protein IFR05_007696 [Cadophora sp. M221]|nr:hypothetical protein IFR05_007696 [Cadophora sp. M221]
MASRSFDFDVDVDRDRHVAFRSTPPPRNKMSKGFFSFENPGFVLVLYNFLLALPLAYMLTHLNKLVISWIGYEKIMRCPSGIVFSRLLFVALNMWLVVGWGLQLEREAREKKGVKMERVRTEVKWWEREVERLEGVLGGVRQREIEEQFLRESPSGLKNGSANGMRNGHGKGSGTVPPNAGPSPSHEDAEQEHDHEEEDDEDEDGESQSEESGDGEDGDSDWNGVD